MSKAYYQFFLFWAGSFICLYLAFSPAVNVPYTNHDSIRYFHKFYNHERGFQTNPLYGYLQSDGRFASAELEEMLYKNIDHLSDMSRLRLMSIAVIALSASLLIMIAQSGGMETLPAFCVCTAMFTLPGIQDIIFVPYPYVVFAVFLSLLAYLILTRKWMYGTHFIFTLILLEVSFFMYPPATFFFLVPTALLVIFNQQWQMLKKIWLRDISLWLLAAAIFYFILRVFFYVQIESTHHEIAFTCKQVLSNMRAFLPKGLPQIFNLWNVYYSKALGISLIVFVAAFLSTDIIIAKKIGWKRLCALAVIFFIFNLVWFLFGGYMPRQFMAAQALALALLYWCGEKLGRIWPVLLLCTGLFIGNQMMTSNVLNNYSELMFIRSRLAQFVSSSTKEIHIIGLKDTSRGYNGLPVVYDNINSSVQRHEAPDLVRVALKDLANPFELHCIVTYSNDGETFTLLPNAVVVDMNDLVYISSSENK